MKLVRTSAFLIIFVGSAAFATAQATSQPPRGNVGIFGAYAASASDGLDRGHGGGASVTVFFSRLMGIEGGFRRQSFDVVASSSNAVSGGELSANIITGNIVARGASGSIQPYVSAGVAFFSSGYSIDAAVQSQLSTFNFAPNESFDNTVGFNIAGGADFQASQSIGFFVEGRYIAATVNTTGGLTDQASQTTATLTGRQELNLLTVVGGIRIFF